jgi:hypothetical protein
MMGRTTPPSPWTRPASTTYLWASPISRSALLPPRPRLSLLVCDLPSLPLFPPSLPPSCCRHLAHKSPAPARYETAILGSPFTITVPKIKCPGGGTCSGHGTCKDNGDCVCEGAYDSSDCSVDLIQPYRDAIVIENVILGVFIFIYGVYTALSGGPKDRGDGMLGELDDEDDEEVQFQGLKCCMHW